MKFTNNEIYNLATRLNEMFQDTNQRLPIKLNFFLQKNKKTLLEFAQEIEESRMDILRTYGEIDEESGNLRIPEDKVAAANKEIIDLLSLEQEVAIKTVKFEDIPEDISLTTGQMEAIIFMID
jgi:hypothetical protein